MSVILAQDKFTV